MPEGKILEFPMIVWLKACLFKAAKKKIIIIIIINGFVRVLDWAVLTKIVLIGILTQQMT